MSTNKYQKSYFDVLGLCCSSEIPLIEKLLKPLDGVKEVSVVVASRTVIVVHDNLIVSQLQIVNVLNKARLEANARVHGQTNYIQKWPSPYAIACGVCLALSFLKNVYDPFKWLAIVSVVIGILPIVLKGYAALRNFTLDTNILVLIAVMGSIALHDYWEAASIVFLFTIAQWLESRASHKATAVMSSLMNMVPQKAILAETGEEIDASEVTLNTILAVKPGENIPIDGIVVDGKCEVDEKTLTGESFPVSKQIDSTVFAGTINLNGYISVKTTALAEDCVVAKMAKLVEEAQNNKSQTQRFIDKCAMFYTPAIVVISICLAAIPAILKVDNQRHWFHLALVVLVSGCPCALILSTPVATFCALSRAATSGLLIKGGEYLETLSKIKIIGFDKTGTITRGEFVVTDFEVMVGGLSLNTMLYWVSSIESKSSHPMAAALIDYAESLGIKPEPDNVEEFENYPGEGIYGKIDGKIIYIGNRRIALRAGSGAGPNLGGTAGEGKSIGYIYLGGDCAGIFSLIDTCRSGAKEAIDELKSMGIKTAMLTGDSNEAATIAQNQLDGALEMVHAELLPQDKANIIKDFQQEAPTAMVGDGLNDAPALATADIGISMGVSGSALATETGHIILMSNDIRKIPEVLKLAKQTRSKVIQNVFISILTKAAILGLAIGGYPLVWAAVLADVGTCLVVIFNSMLLLKGTEQGHCHNSSWRSCFRKRGCHSHGEHNNHKCHSHSEHDNHKCHSHSEHDNHKCHSQSEDNNHKCHSHGEDNNHKYHSHSENNNHKCHSHGESNNHKCHSHGHDHSHSIEEQTRHCLSPCQDHKHFSKPSHINSCKSSHSHEHNHYSSTREAKGSCQHIEVSEDVKHNHEGRSSSQKHIPCYDHAKSLIPVPTSGCCSHDNVLKAKKHSKVHDSTRSNGKHKHHCSNSCNDHVKNVKPIPTNGCCEHKDRIEEVEHMHDHILGHNGEHKHEENGHFPVEKFEHFVEIGEECHSNHVSSTGNCHTMHSTENTHEENRDFHEIVAHCCKNDNESVQQLCDNSSKCSSLHEKEACGATKACSSKLEKRHVHDCCRSFREERRSRNSRFGGSVGGLSEIIVE